MELSSVNSTALWTASVRAQEHRKANSLIKDPYAARFVDKSDTTILENFKDLEKPRTSIISRHHFIDNYLSNNLQSNKQQFIVTIGCGFDCRPFRLTHGKWYEVDQAAIIEFKENILPASQCGNLLQRISADITTVQFVDVLKNLPLIDPIFVIEGVFNYLNESAVQQLLNTVKTEFPNCTVICDLMNETFYSKYAKDFRAALASVNLSYRYLRNDYPKFLQNLGFSIVEAHSIIDLSIQVGLFSVPKIIRKLFLAKLAEGYTLYILRPSD